MGRAPHKNQIDLDYDEPSTNDSLLVSDRGIYFSADGRRRTEEVVHNRQKRRRLLPDALNDSLACWIPVPDHDFTEGAANISAATLDPEEPPVVLGKRKQYASTVCRHGLQKKMLLVPYMRRSTQCHFSGP
jgi:hypothetical protein